jgi:predicted O-methyltransferase YrrM
MIQIANKIVNRFGYQIKLEKSNFPYDIKGNKEFMDLYSLCKKYSMTSLERMFGLYQALFYVIENNIQGDFVECGVWKGGSAMMMALVLKKYNLTNRKLYLYDTFEGMSEPTELDKTAKGTEAAVLMKHQKNNKGSDTSVWCYSPLEEVKKNLLSTGYPDAQIRYIKGKVEDTLNGQLPGKLALLRLDTDWYESTRIELQVLYPLLEKKGVMIIDDFGHWEGAKKAVIEYFESIHEHPLLQRIDYTGRLMIKI